jgi:iron(III) transport system ATP-binding protein
MSQANSVGVSIRNVDLSYGSTRVLKDVSLEIEPGEFFAFLGPSGCGKTTLLRLIAGFARAQAGEVRIAGADVSGLPPWRRDVGMVFQSYALWPHMTVARNVAFGLEERGVPRAEIRARVAEALRLVGLDALADRRPSQLSGGQQQRVALARTIVVRPKVLLLDEPLSNLDAKLRVQVRREIRELQRALGLTTIFVTHDQEEANAICDRIAVMSEGEVQQVGAPTELYQRPVNAFVAGFLGTANILPGRIDGAGAARRFVFEGGTATLGEGAGQGTKLMVRPQLCLLADPAEPPRPGWVRLAGEVKNREFLGAAVRYAVATPAGEMIVDRPYPAREIEPEIGATVLVEFEPASAWVVS